MVSPEADRAPQTALQHDGAMKRTEPPTAPSPQAALRERATAEHMTRAMKRGQTLGVLKRKGGSGSYKFSGGEQASLYDLVWPVFKEHRGGPRTRVTSAQREGDTATLSLPLSQSALC